MMFSPRLFVSVILLALSVATAHAAGPQPDSRSPRDIEGWRVLVDDRLLESSNEELGARAMRFLESKLFDIKAIVPKNRVEQLQQVTIVLDLSCGGLESMQYHPSDAWLTANGYPADLVKCVHLPKAVDVATPRNINEQPWVILHELAHAYHDQFLGFDHPEIVVAYERYRDSGKGDTTLLYDGRRVKHYALTDPKEFFAEMTEAFFGSNDFYPFNRAELLETEPEIYRLLDRIWRHSDQVE